MSSNLEVAREKLKKISSSGVVDSNTIARLLRLPLTKLMFVFSGKTNLKTYYTKYSKHSPKKRKQ